MTIQATIDTHIHFDPARLSSEILKEILGRLTIKNPRKDRALREMLWGAEDLPDYLELWKWNSSGEIVLPRGFSNEFEKILEDNNTEIDWKVNMTLNIEILDGPHTNVNPISLRDYQSRAVDDLNRRYDGIYKGETGVGKTRVMLELIRIHVQRTIVICEKKDIAKQWVSTAEEFGFNVGMIGDGKWEDKNDLVIVLRQSLIRNESLDEWYNQWGMVVIDECHHQVSDSMLVLVQRFPAYYRYGCSATPDSDQELFPITQAVIGPIVHTTTAEKAQEAIIIPRVKVVETEFEFDYRPTVRVGSKVIRNNYSSMMKALEIDSVRNTLIAELILSEAREGNDCLVVSKRINHLDEIGKIIHDKIRNDVIMFAWLTGKNSYDSGNVAKDIDTRESPWVGSVLLSTLAEEGTDIPRLNRLFLTYPGRKTRGYEQTIGRIMRKHPDKKDAIVYDFRDKNISILNSQFRERMHTIYNKKGYEVEFI